jgi:hypothetical protein
MENAKSSVEKAVLLETDPVFDPKSTGEIALNSDQLTQFKETFERIEHEVRDLVAQNWLVIERVAGELSERRIISGEEVDAAIAKSAKA